LRKRKKEKSNKVNKLLKAYRKQRKNIKSDILLYWHFKALFDDIEDIDVNKIEKNIEIAGNEFVDLKLKDDSFTLYSDEYGKLTSILKQKVAEVVDEVGRSMFTGSRLVSRERWQKTCNGIANMVLAKKEDLLTIKTKRGLENYILKYLVYCPICGDINLSIRSDYLFKQFQDFETYWASVLVTHYRHEHIKYYDRSWMYKSYAEKNPEYKNHDEYKKIVNNRAKRQLIRTFVKDAILDRNTKIRVIKAFRKLQANDGKTLELIDKSLKKLNEV